MPIYKKPLYSSSSSGALGAAVSANSAAFQRGSLERRSLRWKKMSPSSPSSVMQPVKHKSKSSVPAIRTSIDLELDRQVSGAPVTDWILKLRKHFIIFNDCAILFDIGPAMPSSVTTR